MTYMDGFDSNFKDQSDQQSGLPEGFGWDDMKGGIYEKMQTTDTGKNNRHWILLLLLLLIVGGIGSWFMVEYLDNEETMTTPIAPIQENNKENDTKSDNIRAKVNSSQQNDSNHSTDNTLSQSNQKHEKIAVTKKKTIKSLRTNTTQFANKPRKSIFNNNLEEAKPIIQNESNIPSRHNTFEQPQKNETTDNLSLNAVAVSSEMTTETSTTTNRIPSIDFGLIESKSSDIAPFKTPESTKASAFKKYLSLGLAGGIMNWTAFDAANINHDYVNGFLGYTINPSVSLSIRPKHALQMDYEYSTLEELFDYEGTHNIEVLTVNQPIRRVVSSLTGNVMHTERKDTILSGNLYQRELKYNQYKFHTLSLGYRFDQATKKKSSFGFYVGASYLLQLNGKGKRLNEQLNVIAFDNDNPLFQNNQFGLRFGVHYNYQLNPNTQLFSQVMTTKYISNWELDNSNSATRPFLYGLQIGLRSYLMKPKRPLK